MRVLPLLLGAAAASATGGAQPFSLLSDFTGEKFFDGFDWFTGHDPTDGCVEFLNESDARAAGLTGINAAGQVFMRTDNTTLHPADAGGRTARKSVRVSSSTTFDPKTLGGGTNESGSVMVVLDVAHMPTGCGVWPAFWMNSVLGTWPSQGEIDLIEGVNKNVDNTYTLHTNSGCSQLSIDDSDFSGHWITNKAGTQNATNCDVNCPGQDQNQGCSVGSSPAGARTYGAPFNAAGGGVFVMLWDYQKPTAPSPPGAVHHDGQIALWFLDRQSTPHDLLNANGHPQPPATKPMGRFRTSERDCPAAHFNKQQIIFDITLCGQWAGREFIHDCPAEAAHYPGMDTYNSCDAYVGGMPNAFSESRWEINSLRVFSTTRPGGKDDKRPAGDGPEKPGWNWLAVGAGILGVVAMLLASGLVAMRRSKAGKGADGGEALSAPMIASG